jgi:hypothetical protein
MSTTIYITLSVLNILSAPRTNQSVSYPIANGTVFVVSSFSLSSLSSPYVCAMVSGCCSRYSSSTSLYETPYLASVLMNKIMQCHTS